MHTQGITKDTLSASCYGAAIDRPFESLIGSCHAGDETLQRMAPAQMPHGIRKPLDLSLTTNSSMKVSMSGNRLLYDCSASRQYRPRMGVLR